MEFIAIAERSTAIHSITRAVFKKGLKAAQHLPEHVAVSFNISACDLTSACTLSFIRNEIASAGIAPGRIWIEVTETAVMHADAAAQAPGLSRPWRRHRARRFRHRLFQPWLCPAPASNKIKIDRSFVSALDSEDGGTITSAVITLCHTIGLSCVAEGVETRRNARFWPAPVANMAKAIFSANPSRSKNCCPIAAVASAYFRHCQRPERHRQVRRRVSGH
jgi:predicted signal transduction protein with EAL and GGDEF domain